MYEIIWRPGPEFSLSVPVTTNRSKNVVVRDSWVRSSIKFSPEHSLMHWTEDAYLLIDPLTLKQDRGIISILVPLHVQYPPLNCV